MSKIRPLTSLEFTLPPKGLYRFVVKETRVDDGDPTRDSGKRFVAICEIADGEYKGFKHTESFFERSKDDFSLRRLAGFLIKIGAMRPASEVDSELFTSPEFAKRWVGGMVVNREFGAKLDYRYDKSDVSKERPFTSMVAYYTVAELEAERAKRKSVVAPVHDAWEGLGESGDEWDE